MEQLGYKDQMEALRWKDITNSPLPSGQTINLQGPILPRLDSELAGAAKKAGK